jgi:hypothetical protein
MEPLTTRRYTGKGVPTPDHSLYLDKIAGQIEMGRWHLSLTSLLNALKQGETLKEIKGFINQISLKNPGKPLEKFKPLNTHTRIIILKCTLKTNFKQN